ncbi:MAG: hypothetical protein KBI02_01345 [Thermomonas sp.]|uniref:hypothetical protein n=1 Tax=Thermomonas sp. TaxID=1971895 RepID=UPI001B6D535E|nr:hypothetical protein [Thermomonas sp.]MBP7157670.1 hypothetical protein [Thermomonas sp.]MBP7788306.1 hypothetical protein [Thermomonas sp.]MBP8614795.1 hypothetical protein [Thermomonas sp.]MBP8647037.1 hypothetical protein [Thermomonas sp.]
MLPQGFHWAPRWQYEDGANAVFCGSMIVAYLDQRIDGGWFARMDNRMRPCSSYEAGRAGCEAWVARHQERLRAAAAEYEASLPRMPWIPRASGTPLR